MVAIVAVGARLAVRGYFGEKFLPRGVPADRERIVPAQRVLRQPLPGLGTGFLERDDAEPTDGLALAAHTVGKDETLCPALAHPDAEARNKIIGYNDGALFWRRKGAD